MELSDCIMLDVMLIWAGFGKCNEIQQMLTNQAHSVVIELAGLEILGFYWRYMELVDIHNIHWLSLDLGLPWANSAKYVQT